jgi:6-pyruvoyltetrahydropterin/6-carboxytetrahydropterin synthase
MYYLEKRIEIAGAHFLELDYASKCENLHGHNWIITVYCKSEYLNQNGMIIDFSKISKVVKELDHQDLNKFIKQPTAENIAKYLCDKISFCYCVKVQESEGNIITYEKV